MEVLIMGDVKKWFGRWPDNCRICGIDLSKKEWFADAKSNYGPWGLFCPECHEACCSQKFGTGIGQKYDSKTLIKLEG
jgi:hypothetical protein